MPTHSCLLPPHAGKDEDEPPCVFTSSSRSRFSPPYFAVGHFLSPPPPPVHISKPPLDENRGIDSLRCVLVRKFFSIKLGAKLVEHLDVLCREYCSSSNRISTFPRRRLSSSAPIVGEVLSPVGFELNQARRTGFQPQVARRRAGSCTGHSLGPLKCGLRP
jgi:hypothetical protein